MQLIIYYKQEVIFYDMPFEMYNDALYLIQLPPFPGEENKRKTLNRTTFLFTFHLFLCQWAYGVFKMHRTPPARVAMWEISQISCVV